MENSTPSTFTATELEAHHEAKMRYGVGPAAVTSRVGFEEGAKWALETKPQAEMIDILTKIILVWGSPATIEQINDGGGQYASTFKLNERGAKEILQALGLNN